jgi:hypothetical protein
MEQILMTATLLNSIMAHISENTKKLPGLILQKYHAKLLLADRITAVISGAYVISKIYQKMNVDLFVYGLVAIVVTLLSEIGEFLFRSNIKASHTWYCVWHSAWHVMCFDLLGKVFLL